MAECGDDDKWSSESTEEESKTKTHKQGKVRGPAKDVKKGKRAKGNIAGASVRSLRKSKPAVRINPEPVVEELKEFTFSASPEVPFYIPAEKYEWQSCLFHEPKKSAMKQTVEQSPKVEPKVPSKLPPASLNVPSGPLPIKSPNLAELAVERSKTPSVSSKVSSTLPSLTDPSEPSKASTPLLKHASTTRSTSIKEVTSAMPNEPTSVELPKGTGASTQSSVTLKDSTKLPPISPKDTGVNLPAELPLLKSKRTCLPTKLPPIEKPPEKSPEKSPLRKSPTWPTFRIEPQLPPILPIHSSKGASKGSTATMPPTDYSTMQPMDSSGMVPLISSGELSLMEQDTMPLKIAKENLLRLQITPQEAQVSPEKTAKEVIKPVDIADGDPEIVSVYN